MKAAVIGSGPSGMLAALAALQCDIKPVVFIPPGSHVRSRIHGAQYVHAKIQGIPDDISAFTIRYSYVGTEEEYRQKIYGGSVPPGGTSWGRYGPVETAWSMQEVYEWLCENILPRCQVVEQTVNPSMLHVLTAEFPYVLNTAPLNVVWPEAHYQSETVYIGTYLPNGLRIEDNSIVYLGDPAYMAYRISRISSNESVEYPLAAYEKLNYFARRGLTKINKPLYTLASVPGVHLLGRYGRWSKGQLVHHVYEDSLKIFMDGMSWQATQQQT